MNWFYGFTRSTRDIAVLCLLGVILWLTSSGMWDLRGPDEGRYVQIAKELLTRDNWLYLTVHGVPYDQKPPLAFWLFALMLKLNGGEVASWIVRVPSVMAAIATVVMTYFMGSHSFGRRAGFFAGLILLTSPLFFDNAPAAELNMLYTAAITGALCVWITRPGDGQKMSGLRLMGFWASLAAAFFIKGPLALVIVFSVVGWEAWTARSWATVWLIRPWSGILALSGLIAGWLYFQSEIYGEAFVKEQVSGETLNRIMSGDHTEPFWYYLPRIFTSVLFPWSLLTIPATMAYLVTPRHLRQSLTKTPYFAWLLFPFLLLCVANGKRQNYLLPLVPAATILLGSFIDPAFAGGEVRKTTLQIWGWTIGAFGFVVVGAGAIMAIQPDRVQNDLIWISWVGIALLIGCGFLVIVISCWLTRGQGRANRIVYAGAAVILVGAWGNFMVVRPALDPVKSTRYLSDALDMELSKRGGERSAAVIGAVGDAAKAEYHVYGHYSVRGYRTADAGQATSNTARAPDFILLKAGSKQYSQIARSLVDAGYTHRRTIVVSKDMLTLFKKPVVSRTKRVQIP